jgi:hypothetical protein
MPRGSNLIDMIGVRTGSVVVIARAESKGGKCTNARWVYLCDCGREGVVRGADLRNGNTKSCGCSAGDYVSASQTVHGHARIGLKTRTYRVWMAMNYRCRSATAKEYKYYGGRGICICERWSAYANFLADMGEAPPGLSLDRIDNDGNYEPGNCRWATHSQQVSNRRRLTPPPTHCQRGHRYTEENTGWNTSRGNRCRVCRICRNAYQRAQRNKLGAQEAANAAL